MDSVDVEMIVFFIGGFVVMIVFIIVAGINGYFNDNDSKKKAESLNEKPNNGKQSDRESIALERERRMNIALEQEKRMKYESDKAIEELKKEIEKLRGENEEYKRQYEKGLKEKKEEYERKLAMLDEAYISKIDVNKTKEQ